MNQFLKQGAVLQIGSDEFILMTSPVSLEKFCYDSKNLSINTLNAAILDMNADLNPILVYCPKFWDFLEDKINVPDIKIDSLIIEPKHYRFYLSSVLLNLKAFKELLLNHISIQNLNLENLKMLSLAEDSKKDFEKQYLWAQDQFTQGDLKKAVPIAHHEYVSSEAFDTESASSIALLNALENINSGTKLYGHWSDEELILGHTPETLITWKDNQILTMAIAGTWSHEKNYHSLQDIDYKTKEEHQIVVDDIKEKLKLPQSVSFKTEILKLPFLNHLKTEIFKPCFQLLEFIQIIYSLHPTAALGIYPHNQEKYKELKNFKTQKNREYFGAPFGIIDLKSNSQNLKSQIIVGIRNIHWVKKDKKISIFSGCGVTELSDFESEWFEILTKTESIKKVFKL